MNTLPDNIKAQIYEYDNTYRDQFDNAMDELEDKTKISFKQGGFGGRDDILGIVWLLSIGEMSHYIFTFEYSYCELCGDVCWDRICDVCLSQGITDFDAVSQYPSLLSANTG